MPVRMSVPLLFIVYIKFSAAPEKITLYPGEVFLMEIKINYAD